MYLLIVDTVGTITITVLTVRLVEILSVLPTLLCRSERTSTRNTLTESHRERITFNGWIDLLIFFVLLFRVYTYLYLCL